MALNQQVRKVPAVPDPQLRRKRTGVSDEGDAEPSPCQFLEGKARQTQHRISSLSTTRKCGKNWTGGVCCPPGHGKKCWQITLETHPATSECISEEGKLV